MFGQDAYIAAGIMNSEQANALRDAVAARKNILVAGGTPTGKATLTDALLAEVAKGSDRVVLIEDTRELQCSAPNLVALRTKDGVVSLSDLVRSSLCLRPDRIPIGELLGAEALDLLKDWGTGHPGGIGTIDAGTALGALRPLEQLIQEAVVMVPRALIAETVNVIAVLSRRGTERRLSELASITELGPSGDYSLSKIGSHEHEIVSRARFHLGHGIRLLVSDEPAGLGRWEQPLNQIVQSVEGPVAKIIVVIIIVTGLSLACGNTRAVPAADPNRVWAVDCIRR